MSLRVGRGDLRDVFVEDGRSAVFVNEQVIVLSEIATLILQAIPAEGAVTLKQVTADVLAVVGPPEAPLDADELVSRQVHELVAHGILRTDDPPPTAGLTPRGVQGLRDALRHVLSSTPGTWAPVRDVPGEEVLAASARHRVTPTLAAHLDRLTLPPATSARIDASAAQERATVDLLAADLHRAIDLLNDASIRCLTFKGLALAAQAHGGPAARGTGDLDLLVHPDDLEAAHRALAAGGWEAAAGYPVPGPSWAWRHHVRTGYELSLTGPTSMIDLHWSLSPARSAFPDFDTLWARSVRVEVLGRQVPTLSPYDALAHSASHSAKDGWGWLRGLVDVHRLVADPTTWLGADRPLRHDQLLTVGIAARMFGVPDGSPPVVRQAVGLTGEVWEEVLARQSSGGASHEPTTVPGLTLVRALRNLRWADAAWTDVWRRLSFTAMPHWLTVDEASRYAAVAVPRVLARRAVGFASSVTSVARPPA